MAWLVLKSRCGIRSKWIFWLVMVEISAHVPLVVASSVVFGWLFGRECKGDISGISIGFCDERRQGYKPMLAGFLISHLISS